MSALTANERLQLDDVFLSIDCGNTTLKQLKNIFLEKLQFITISNLLKFMKIKQ